MDRSVEIIAGSAGSRVSPMNRLTDERRRQYWRANLRLVAGCLLVWFFSSYVAGILLAELLNRYQLFGYPLGFWFAQQGSIYVFLVLIFVYAWRMNALDRRFGTRPDPEADSRTPH